MSLRGQGSAPGPSGLSQHDVRAMRLGERLLHDIDPSHQHAEYEKAMAFLLTLDRPTIESVLAAKTSGVDVAGLLTFINTRALDSGDVARAMAQFQMSCTAEQILKKPISGLVAATQRSKSVSKGNANSVYQLDPISLQRAGYPIHERLLTGLVKSYDNSENAWRFPEPVLSPHYMSVEGDVATYSVVQIINPVINVFNKALEAAGHGWRLSLRAQTGFTSGFIDHIIMLHGDWRIAEQRRGRGLVVYEEKIIKGLKSMLNFIQRRGPPVIPDSTSYFDVSAVIPQTRRYVFEMKTPYAVCSDGVNHFSFIWGSVQGWQLGGKTNQESPQNDSYGRLQHQQHRAHTARVVQGFNQPRHELQQSPRFTLALLIYMALSDLDILPSPSLPSQNIPPPSPV